MIFGILREFSHSHLTPISQRQELEVADGMESFRVSSMSTSTSTSSATTPNFTSSSPCPCPHQFPCALHSSASHSHLQSQIRCTAFPFSTHNTHAHTCTNCYSNKSNSNSGNRASALPPLHSLSYHPEHDVNQTHVHPHSYASELSAVACSAAHRRSHYPATHMCSSQQHRHYAGIPASPTRALAMNASPHKPRHFRLHRRVHLHNSDNSKPEAAIPYQQLINRGEVVGDDGDSVALNRDRGGANLKKSYNSMLSLASSVRRCKGGSSSSAADAVGPKLRRFMNHSQSTCSFTECERVYLRLKMCSSHASALHMHTGPSHERSHQLTPLTSYPTALELAAMSLSAQSSTANTPSVIPSPKGFKGKTEASLATEFCDMSVPAATTSALRVAHLPSFPRHYALALNLKSIEPTRLLSDSEAQGRDACTQPGKCSSTTSCTEGASAVYQLNQKAGPSKSSATECKESNSAGGEIENERVGISFENHSESGPNLCGRRNLELRNSTPLIQSFINSAHDSNVSLSLGVSCTTQKSKVGGSGDGIVTGSGDVGDSGFPSELANSASLSLSTSLIDEQPGLLGEHENEHADDELSEYEEIDEKDNDWNIPVGTSRSVKNAPEKYRLKRLLIEMSESYSGRLRRSQSVYSPLKRSQLQLRSSSADSRQVAKQLSLSSAPSSTAGSSMSQISTPSSTANSTVLATGLQSHTTPTPTMAQQQQQQDNDTDAVQLRTNRAKNGECIHAREHGDDETDEASSVHTLSDIRAVQLLQTHPYQGATECQFPAQMPAHTSSNGSNSKTGNCSRAVQLPKYGDISTESPLLQEAPHHTEKLSAAGVAAFSPPVGCSSPCAALYNFQAKTIEDRIANSSTQSPSCVESQNLSQSQSSINTLLHAPILMHTPRSSSSSSSSSSSNNNNISSAKFAPSQRVQPNFFTVRLSLLLVSILLAGSLIVAAFTMISSSSNGNFA